MSIDPQRVQALFLGALEASDPVARRDFLDQQCRSDQALRRRVEALLAAHDAQTGFDGEPSGPPLGATLEPSTQVSQGTLIAGRYKLLEAIGEGGMGTVWVAEQTQPVKRKVALKLIKAGMDSRSVLARFEAERQALALMDHPNIATVLDGGLTAEGRPYFVMEYVRGVPLTEYCDARRLTVSERLRLFAPVCQAVQHAHQKGIIHRDLKPSNILVALYDDEPVPKVIDFGLAKAMHQPLTENTVYTAHDMVMGTPLYMSPEQAQLNNMDIDTRSDVYALGVLLYELLTGSTPLERQRFHQAAWDEMRRMIREEDPPLPSTRLSSIETLASVAAVRHTEPTRLTRQVRGELDWIVMKALEKDRSRRYESANGLAADVLRYLAGEPVAAAPPSKLYRVQKFVRRHRATVVAATLIVAALLAGIAGTSWQWLRAKRALESEAHQRSISDANARAADAARTQALAQEAAAAAQEKLAKRRAAELQEVAEFQAAQLAGLDAATMGVQIRAGLLQKFLDTAKSGGLAAAEVDRQRKELEQLLAGVDFTGLATETLQANIFQRALATIDAEFSEQPLVKARLLQTVAETLVELGLVADAVGPQTEALALRRAALSSADPETAASVQALAVLNGQLGKLNEALPLFDEAIETRRNALGPEHPDTLTSIFAKGTALYFQGKYAEAEACFGEAAAGRRRVLGIQHRDTLQTVRALSMLRLAQGNLAEAESLAREAAETCRSQFGPLDADTLVAFSGLSSVLKWQRKYAEALELDRSIADARRQQLGEEHPETLNANSSLGETLRNLKDLAAAELLLRETVQRQRLIRGSLHPDTLTSISRLGMVLADAERFVDAEPFYREALDGRRRQLGNDHPNTITSLNNLGYLFQQMGKLSEAKTCYQEALGSRLRIQGQDHPATMATQFNLGKLQLQQDKPGEAEATLRDTLERERRVLGDNHPETLGTLHLLGQVHIATGDYAQAEAELRDCYEQRRAKLPADDPRLLETSSLLGTALSHLGRFSAAEPLLVAAYPPTAINLTGKLRREILERIVDFYQAWNEAEPDQGHAAQVSEWQTKLRELQ